MKLFAGQNNRHGQTVVSGLYLHGEIESEANFDLVFSDTACNFQPGVWPVVVGLEDGSEMEAIAFVWPRLNFPGNTGLIVKSDDRAACRFAAKCFLNEEESL